MSSKAKKEAKGKQKKETSKAAKVVPKASLAPATKVARASKPRGVAPLAIVSSRHEGAMIERQARGFSMGELDGAGFSLHEAGRMGLATDIRRRTVLEKNVESLKGWFAPPIQAPAPTLKPAVSEAVEETVAKPRKKAPAKKTKK